MLTVNDLMLRYGIKNSVSIRKFVARHIEKINSDGEHAKQISAGWQFDDEAVRRIDRLRGLSQAAVIEQTESERVKELQQENENLRQLLLVAQSKLIKSQENLTKNQILLLESEKKILILESQSKDSKSALRLEQALHSVTKQQLEDYKTQLEKIKNCGLIDRIFNNF